LRDGTEVLLGLGFLDYRLLQVSREVSALVGSFYCTKVVCERIGIMGT